MQTIVNAEGVQCHYREKTSLCYCLYSCYPTAIPFHLFLTVTINLLQESCQRTYYCKIRSNSISAKTATFRQVPMSSTWEYWEGRNPRNPWPESGESDEIKGEDRDREHKTYWYIEVKIKCFVGIPVGGGWSNITKQCFRVTWSSHWCLIFNCRDSVCLQNPNLGAGPQERDLISERSASHCTFQNSWKHK